MSGRFVLPDYLREPTEAIFNGGRHAIVKSGDAEAAGMLSSGRGAGDWTVTAVERHPDRVGITAVHFAHYPDGIDVSRSKLDITEEGIQHQSRSGTHNVSLERFMSHPIQYFAQRHLERFEDPYEPRDDLLRVSNYTHDPSERFRAVRARRDLFGSVVREFLERAPARV